MPASITQIKKENLWTSPVLAVLNDQIRPPNKIQKGKNYHKLHTYVTRKITVLQDACLEYVEIRSKCATRESVKQIPAKGSKEQPTYLATLGPKPAWKKSRPSQQTTR
jgi:hypothetical protein